MERKHSPPFYFTLTIIIVVENSRNTTATSTSAAASPASSTAPASQSTPQNEQNSPALPVWAIVVIVIAAVIIIIAAIALTWLVRNIRRNRQRDHQPLNKNDTDHDEALENMAPIMGNTSSIAGSPTSNTPKSMTAISGGMMATNNTDNNSNSNHNKTNNTINKSLGPNFNHIDTNDLSSSIHSSTPMMHGSIRGSPTVPSPSSIDRPPSITTTVSSPNNAALHHLQQHDSSHQPTSSILSSTDALMIADTFRQFMRKPDWSDPPAASEDLQDDHHYDDETDEQKRMRVGNELLQKQLAEEGTTMKDIERR
jgi:ABC-type nickel/cobalt efflux system permease component RcnA